MSTMKRNIALFRLFIRIHIIVDYILFPIALFFSRPFNNDFHFNEAICYNNQAICCGIHASRQFRLLRVWTNDESTVNWYVAYSMRHAYVDLSYQASLYQCIPTRWSMSVWRQICFVVQDCTGFHDAGISRAIFKFPASLMMIDLLCEHSDPYLPDSLRWVFAIIQHRVKYTAAVRCACCNPLPLRNLP
jgi:hypothetical protein